MMPILQIGICNQNIEYRIQNTDPPPIPPHRGGMAREGVKVWALRSSLKGFTLIELIAVIFIISLAMVLIMPSVWQTEKDILKTEANRIGSTLRYVYDESIGKKQIYLFKINFDKRIWGFESDTVSRNFEIKGTPGIKDIIIPSLGEVSFGEVIIRFGPMGTEEPITLHLKNGKTGYTVMFNHLSGRAKILEGYLL